MGRNYPNFLENTVRYLTWTGSYPYNIKIRKPIGVIVPRLFSHHDILTVNVVWITLLVKV